MRGLIRGAGAWDGRSGSLVSRGQWNPAPKGARLAVRTSVATHCSKDLPYLPAQNCRHIARVGKMTIFLFIFSDLLDFCLREIKLFAEPGFVPAAGPRLSLSSGSMSGIARPSRHELQNAGVSPAAKVSACQASVPQRRRLGARHLADVVVLRGRGRDRGLHGHALRYSARGPAVTRV